MHASKTFPAASSSTRLASCIGRRHRSAAPSTPDGEFPFPEPSDGQQSSSTDRPHGYNGQQRPQKPSSQEIRLWYMEKAERALQRRIIALRTVAEEYKANQASSPTAPATSSSYATVEYDKLRGTDFVARKGVRAEEPREEGEGQMPALAKKKDVTSQGLSAPEWVKLRASRVTGQEQEQDAPRPEGEADHLASFVKGTLVHVDCPSRSGLAVVLDTVLLQGLNLRLLFISGEIEYHPTFDITRTFQQIRLPLDLASNVGKFDSIRFALPENHAARRTAIQLLRKVVRSEQEVRARVEALMRESWEHFRSAIEDERALVSTEAVEEWAVEQDLAQLVTGNGEVPSSGGPSRRTEEDWQRREEVLRYAVSRHLLDRSDRYIAESGRDAWALTRWRVRSKREVDEMQVVRTMIEEQSADVLGFVEKAQALIDRSRPSFDAPTPEDAASAPSPQLLPADPTLPVFSETDLLILRHIQASFFVSRRQESPFSPTVPWILKRTQRYGEVVDAECTARFLAEIGVRCEWDNWAALGSTLEFVKGELRTEAAASASSALPAEAATLKSPLSRAQPSSTPTLGEDELYPSDPVEHLRHDFGQLNVFVIDDPDAAELDDGISIERTEDPAHVWVHTHIADPTTLLHPGHRLAKQGLARASTAYLPEGNYPLLPDSLTLDRFSLGGKGGVVDPVKGQESLSFSARVDINSGEMLDYTVRAGIIRNVHVTSYEAVNSALGCPSSQPLWPIGRPPERFSATKPRPFKDDWLPDLKLLQKVAVSIQRQRVKAGSMGWTSDDYKTKVHPSPLPSLPMEPTRDPRLSEGAPFVSYRVSPAMAAHSESGRLVASCMTLAGNIAGRFFRDRGLPTAYRHSPPAVTKKREDLEELLALRDPDWGYVSTLDVERLGVSLLAGRISLTPETHWGMGITAADGGYVRVTSPLRRYGDIIAHWQIKQVLLAEAASSTSAATSLSAATPLSKQLFTPAEVHDMAQSVELTSNLVKQASDLSKAFWGVYALQRYARKQSSLDAFSHNIFPPLYSYPFIRSPLAPTARLGPYEARVTRANRHPLQPRSRTVSLVVPELGQRIEAHYPKGADYQPGDPVSVLIDEFYLGPQPAIIGTVVG